MEMSFARRLNRTANSTTAHGMGPVLSATVKKRLSQPQQEQTHGASLGEVLHVLENTLTNEGLDLVASHEERSVALQVHHPRLRHELTCHTTKARSRHRSHSSEQRLVNAREGREKRSTSLEAVPAAVTLSSHGKK